MADDGIRGITMKEDKRIRKIGLCIFYQLAAHIPDDKRGFVPGTIKLLFDRHIYR
jgi:hypothetical protein